MMQSSLHQDLSLRAGCDIFAKEFGWVGVAFVGIVFVKIVCKIIYGIDPWPKLLQHLAAMRGLKPEITG